MIRTRTAGVILNLAVKVFYNTWKIIVILAWTITIVKTRYFEEMCFIETLFNLFGFYIFPIRFNFIKNARARF